MLQRTTSFDSTKGSFLDSLIWRLRVAKVSALMGSRSDTVADLGCGRTAPLLRELLRAGHAKRAIGLDLDPAPDDPVWPALEMVRADLNSPLPLASGSVDLALSLAVLEHLTEPELHLREIRRILKPGGRLMLTTPSPRGKPVLEFLAYRLGVIDRAEIEDHKDYYDGVRLSRMLRDAGFAPASTVVGTFQFGLNNIVTASS